MAKGNGKWAPPEHWPVKEAMRYQPLDWFQPWPKNPRTHPPEEIAILSELLKKYGPDQDIVVDEERWILKGHGRLAAARAAGFTHFTYTQRFGLSEDDKNGMRIADNQIALLAGWDRTLIRAQASELKLHGYDVKLLAFDQATLGWLTSGDPVADLLAEWQGMPQFSNPDARAFRSIVMHFNDQAGVDAFAKKIGFEVTEKTRFIHYPEAIIKPFVKYAGEGSKKRSAAKKGAGA